MAGRFRKGMFGSVSGGLSRHGGLGLFRYGRVWLSMVGRGGRGAVGRGQFRFGLAIKYKQVAVYGEQNG